MNRKIMKVLKRETRKKEVADEKRKTVEEFLLPRERSCFTREREWRNSLPCVRWREDVEGRRRQREEGEKEE